MNKQSRILVVDDEPDLNRLYTIHLEAAGYQVVPANHGQEALAILFRDPAAISLIVSDVMMPVMDGYAFCKAVRNDERSHDIPFIFVSGLITLDEKMKGYAVGGSDYVTKPVLPQELTEKIKHLIHQREHQQALNNQIQEAQKTAMLAMTYSSQLGEILDFFKRSLTAQNLSELSQMLFRYMRQSGLHATIQFKTPAGTVSYRDAGVVTPLEANIMELARDKGRYFDFGPRTFINHEDFSLLVRNMPVSEPECYGMLKDVLGGLCEAIAARAQVIVTEDRQQQKKTILKAVTELLDSVTQSFTDIQKENVSAIEELIANLDEMMMKLDMTQSQEESIRQAAIECLAKVDHAFDKSESLKQHFSEIKQKLSAVLH